MGFDQSKTASNSYAHRFLCKNNLLNKGYNIGHLNIQGICGNNLICKFSELSIMLTSKENEKLHIFGMSETKLKQHKLTGTFEINGFQTPF